MQIDYLFKFNSPENKAYKRADNSKSLETTYINPNNSARDDKNILLRLHELEKMNADMTLLLEQRTKKLTEIVSTNGKFLSIIAHDLRSPFSSIIGILELLKMSLQEFNKAEIEEYVEIIYSSANNTLLLLDNLLDWAVSQNKEKNFKPVRVNLFDQLRDEIENLRTTARQKQIEIVTDISPDLNVKADLQMVKTIIRNLISNAIKYTNNNGTINISASENKQFIEISVKDNGIGITQEIQKKLFKIDYLNSIPGTNNEKGTGLGLLLCKEFVELNGGMLNLASDTGKGSTFYFTLPHYIQTVPFRLSI